MHIRLSKFLRYSAQVEGKDVTIRDVFVSVDDAALRFLLLDIGSWFEPDLALVQIDKVTSLSLVDTKLYLAIDKAAFEAAPQFRPESQDFLDRMPPVIIGPFGNTASPLMMAAAVASGKPTPDDDRAKRADAHLKRFTDLQGLDAFGKDGQLGTIEDIVISTRGFAITHVAINTAKGPSDQQVLVPVQTLRHMARQDTHLVFDLTTSTVFDAPFVPRDEPLSNDEVRALRNYFNIQK
ncbi:MAG: PRC-barrel domain-containing protein [Pseudomonadota bacterium]